MIASTPVISVSGRIFFCGCARALRACRSRCWRREPGLKASWPMCIASRRARLACPYLPPVAIARCVGYVADAAMIPASRARGQAAACPRVNGRGIFTHALKHTRALSSAGRKRGGIWVASALCSAAKNTFWIRKRFKNRCSVSHFCCLLPFAGR